jgi:hypothetical protein
MGTRVPSPTSAGLVIPIGRCRQLIDINTKNAQYAPGIAFAVGAQSNNIVQKTIEPEVIGDGIFRASARNALSVNSTGAHYFK